MGKRIVADIVVLRAAHRFLRCLTPTVCSVRGRVVLEAGEKYSFNDDGSEMTIMEVTKLDEGDYTCIARNKAGESEQELSLTVFGEGEKASASSPLGWEGVTMK